MFCDIDFRPIVKLAFGLMRRFFLYLRPGSVKAQQGERINILFPNSEGGDTLFNILIDDSGYVIFELFSGFERVLFRA